VLREVSYHIRQAKVNTLPQIPAIFLLFTPRQVLSPPPRAVSAAGPGDACRKIPAPAGRL